MIIHGGAPSPFVRKVMVAFEEKGLAFEDKVLIPFPKTPELMEMNPIGKIPVLEISDGRFIPDSSVICAYLEKVHPDPALMPSDPYQYAQALFIEEYCDTRLIEGIGSIYFERFIKKRLFNGEPDEEAVAKQIEEGLTPVLDQVEGLLPDSRDTLLDSGFGLADIAFGAQLSSLRLAGHEIDAGRWPKVRAFSDAVLARSSFQNAIERAEGAAA
jgi:glutathione S-transferase